MKYKYILMCYNFFITEDKQSLITYTNSSLHLPNNMFGYLINTLWFIVEFIPEVVQSVVETVIYLTVCIVHTVYNTYFYIHGLVETNLILLMTILSGCVSIVTNILSVVQHSLSLVYTTYLLSVDTLFVVCDLLINGTSSLIRMISWSLECVEKFSSMIISVLVGVASLVSHTVIDISSLMATSITQVGNFITFIMSSFHSEEPKTRNDNNIWWKYLETLHWKIMQLYYKKVNNDDNNGWSFIQYWYERIVYITFPIMAIVLTLLTLIFLAISVYYASPLLRDLWRMFQHNLIAVRHHINPLQHQTHERDEEEDGDLVNNVHSNTSVREAMQPNRNPLQRVNVNRVSRQRVNVDHVRNWIQDDRENRLYRRQRYNSPRLDLEHLILPSPPPSPSSYHTSSASSSQSSPSSLDSLSTHSPSSSSSRSSFYSPPPPPRTTAATAVVSSTLQSPRVSTNTAPDNDDDDDGNDESKLCIVCMVEQRKVLLRPCNHYCVCEVCVRRLGAKCPVCRENITSSEIIHVYY